MSVEVGITVNIQTDYTGQDVSLSRGDYDEVVLNIDDKVELDMNEKDLDVLIKALVFFRDKRDDGVLETGLNIPDDKHVSFP
jgi:hypothetical protein